MNLNNSVIVKGRLYMARKMESKSTKAETKEIKTETTEKIEKGEQ